ncbi:MAG: hypothetical protein HW416_866 [Chloroflexi bacterium]|nr:hypothetical protein [Chloroflexota bacterium]
MADNIVTDEVRYDSPSGGLNAYLAQPAEGGPFPALVVIHEFTGMIPYVQDVTRRFAREGYLALAPDLYSNDPVRPTLTMEDMEDGAEIVREPDPEAALHHFPAERREAIKRAIEWRANRDGKMWVPDLLAAVDYLKARPDVVEDAVGSIGFCLGGRMSGTMAAYGADLAACVIFYGPVPPLDKVPNIKCPVQGHYGGADHTGCTDKVPQLAEAMKANGKSFEYFIYEGAPHAFHNDTRNSYTPDVAKKSWDTALKFLDQNVKSKAKAAAV